jgi:hypothetical protein
VRQSGQGRLQELVEALAGLLGADLHVPYTLHG